MKPLELIATHEAGALLTATEITALLEHERRRVQASVTRICKEYQNIPPMIVAGIEAHRMMSLYKYN